MIGCEGIKGKKLGYIRIFNWKYGKEEQD
jgi:hypothetical protein